MSGDLSPTYLAVDGYIVLDADELAIVFGFEAMATILSTLCEPPDCCGNPLIVWLTSLYNTLIEILDVDDGDAALNGWYPGDLKETVRSAVDPGWLLCYGQAVSRTTYADLFDAIGTNFGAGDGTTTFNLPDFRGRSPLGRDNMGGSSANRVTAAAADLVTSSGNGGAETHILTTTEMPAHTHGNNLGHTPVSRADIGAGAFIGVISTIDVNAATTSTGSGGAHNNMHPYQTVNVLIYAGA